MSEHKQIKETPFEITLHDQKLLKILAGQYKNIMNLLVKTRSDMDEIWWTVDAMSIYSLKSKKWIDIQLRELNRSNIVKKMTLEHTPLPVKQSLDGAMQQIDELFGFSSNQESEITEEIISTGKRIIYSLNKQIFPLKFKFTKSLENLRKEVKTHRIEYQPNDVKLRKLCKALLSQDVLNYLRVIKHYGKITKPELDKYVQRIFKGTKVISHSKLALFDKILYTKQYVAGPEGSNAPNVVEFEWLDRNLIIDLPVTKLESSIAVKPVDIDKQQSEIYSTDKSQKSEDVNQKIGVVI